MFSRLRHNMWERLQEFTNGVLSRVLRHILSKDPIAPVLSEKHLVAMDRRLVHIISVVNKCIAIHGKDHVLIKDKYSQSATES